MVLKPLLGSEYPVTAFLSTPVFVLVFLFEFFAFDYVYLPLLFAIDYFLSQYKRLSDIF